MEERSGRSNTQIRFVCCQKLPDRTADKAARTRCFGVFRLHRGSDRARKHVHYAFLSFNRYDILKDKGHVSQAEAREKTGAEYDIFNRTQKIESDFDRLVKKMSDKN